MRSLAGLVADLGGWQLTNANAISANGQFIVGGGVDPSGNTEAYLVRSTVPFLAFSAKLQLDVNTTPTKDAFALESSLTLSSTAPAINPLTQPVALQVGTFSTTIPPGSFKQIGPLFTFTRNAREAGFDGVELHGANGYLQDQFLQDGSNHRADAYGGPIENRARLMLETTRAMIDAWSADRVGVRLSPSSFLYGVDDGDKLATFGFVVRALDALGVGYLCLLEPNAKDAERGVQIRNVAETFRPMTSVPIIVNTGFDKAKANDVLSKGHADLVAFGVPFIANPDLVDRLRSDARLNKPDPTTFYGIGPKGYTDYPILAEAVAA